MSTRVRSAIALSVMVVLVALYGYWMYVTRDANRALAEQIVAYNKAHPLNWLDVGLGALGMFLMMMFLFVALSLRETKRFEKEFGGGGNTGGSGGGTKQVRMPMSHKVIDINIWEPPPGQYHRGYVDATT